MAFMKKKFTAPELSVISLNLSENIAASILTIHGWPGMPQLGHLVNLIVDGGVVTGTNIPPDRFQASIGGNVGPAIYDQVVAAGCFHSSEKQLLRR